MSIGRNIRAISAYKNINSVQLSEASGISRETISRILNDKQEPLASTLKSIADALGVTVDFVLNYNLEKGG